jgi:hypothetical protein
MKQTVLPESFLRYVDKKDRAPLGKSGLTNDEANAKAAEKSERVLQNQIVNYCNQNGWIALRSAFHKKTGRTPGEPDFNILLNAGVSLFVECKAYDARESEAQKKLHEKLRSLGHSVEIVRSLPEFIEAVQSAAIRRMIQVNANSIHGIK